MTAEPDPRDGPPRAVAAFVDFARHSPEIAETVQRSRTAVADALGGATVTLLPARGRVTGPDAGPGTPPGPRGPATELSVPVYSGGRLWGRFHVRTPGGRPGTAADREAVGAIAAALGEALDRDRSRKAALGALGRFATESGQVLATMQRTIDLLRTVLDAPGAGVVRLTRAPDAVVIVYGAHGSRIIAGRRVEIDPRLGQALREGDRLVVPDSRGDHRFALPRLPSSLDAAAYVAAALRPDGRAWGWLIALDARTRDFTHAEVEVVTSAAMVLTDSLRRKREEWARAGAELLATRREQAQADLATEVALVDRAGVIVWVNAAWQRFAVDNAADPDGVGLGVGTSYLAVCEAAAAGGDALSAQMAGGIRAAVEGDLPAPMRLLLPCHAPQRDRWFDVLISSRYDADGTCTGAAITLSPCR